MKAIFIAFDQAYYERTRMAINVLRNDGDGGRRPC